ncbi:hypothetical protein ACHAXA_010341 [Cyclostephanos tholiformis]|uniref:Uncharacterized protein n=1 Tax=Cyclostephanos tholiformis TaxID=382380 RepID=A0ABD3RTW6_9STRA
MWADARCLGNGVAVIIIGFAAILGVVDVARRARERGDGSELLYSGVAEDNIIYDGGMAGEFARGYHGPIDYTVRREERRRGGARSKYARGTAVGDHNADEHGERALKGYRKKNVTDSSGATATATKEVEVEEDEAEQGKGERGEGGGGGGSGGEGRDETRENGNGSDVGVESIAEMMTRIQLKLRPPTTDAVLEKRTESIDGVNVVETRNPFPYNYPKLRYVPWHDLSSETKVFLEGAFGYDIGSWNYMSHVVESRAYSTLDAKQRKSLLMLGIDENIWDCFINHYTAYDRDQLNGFGLGQYTDMLLAAETKYWSDLTANEREAATRFCFFKEVWDRDPLGTW